ncbi:hypothetical protein KI659_16340 [Litoribacter alkaliphilus]|uniref:Uncharacterized protein n=1 Tax=Litoribacter ruber TaxID=702568 RepID=A0AAP2CIX1_9BACT|nr:hypothetical protein [Litoribacter alkaliphilus]MBS9525588.1 hypothetical protein [Litoribacter alkaliphilus]
MKTAVLCLPAPRGFASLNRGEQSVSLGLLGLEERPKNVLADYLHKVSLVKKISSYNKPSRNRTVLVDGDRRIELEDPLVHRWEANCMREELENRDAFIFMFDGREALEDVDYAINVKVHLQFINRVVNGLKIIVPIATFRNRDEEKYLGTHKLESKFFLENQLGSSLLGFKIHDIVLANMESEAHLAEIKKALFH